MAGNQRQYLLPQTWIKPSCESMASLPFFLFLSFTSFPFSSLPSLHSPCLLSSLKFPLALFLQSLFLLPFFHAHLLNTGSCTVPRSQRDRSRHEAALLFMSAPAGKKWGSDSVSITDLGNAVLGEGTLKKESMKLYPKIQNER